MTEVQFRCLASPADIHVRLWDPGATCPREGAALGSRAAPLGGPLQQVVQAREAPGQVAEQALLPGALLDRRAGTAHVHWRVRGRVAAGVAQRVVRVDALQREHGLILTPAHAAVTTPTVTLTLPPVAAHGEPQRYVKCCLTLSTVRGQPLSPLTYVNNGALTPSETRRGSLVQDLHPEILTITLPTPWSQPSALRVDSL